MWHLLRLRLRRGVWDVYTENYTVAKRNERTKLAKRDSQFTGDSILVWLSVFCTMGPLCRKQRADFYLSRSWSSQDNLEEKEQRWRAQGPDFTLPYNDRNRDTVAPMWRQTDVSAEQTEPDTAACGPGHCGWRSCQGCLARERMISQQRMLEQLEMPVKTGNWKRSRPFPHTVYKVKVSEQIRAGEEGRRQRRPNSWRQTGSELGPQAGTHEEDMWRLNSIVRFIHSFLCCVCELRWSHLVASAFSWWAV